MIKRFFLSLATALFFCLSQSNIALADRLSANRKESESELSAALRNWNWSTEVAPFGTTVYAARGRLNNEKIARIPEMRDFESMSGLFRQLRDDRFLFQSGRPNFPRRISWLYPDDGCFVRAELSRKKLVEYGGPTPVKLFVFGDLKAKTKNHPRGVVYWWFHVVTAYRLQDKVFVIDPSLEPNRPILVQDWARRMGGPVSKFKFSVCDAKAFGPYSACIGSQGRSHRSTIRLQSDYLRYEWNRALSMGRDPNKVLGDRPPWMPNLGR